MDEDDERDVPWPEESVSRKDKIFAGMVSVCRQRYNAVNAYLNRVQARRVLDIGCADCSLLHSIAKSCPAVQRLCGVDLDEQLVDRSERQLQPLPYEYIHRRATPLSVAAFAGSIATPCAEFLNYDVITMVEIIEHLFDDTLEKVPAAVFGRLRPRAAIVTTPNADFNVLFPDFGTPGGRQFRHWDHKFEWTRAEFEAWADRVARSYGYTVQYSGIGPGMPGTEHLGCCSQMALFERIDVAGQPAASSELRDAQNLDAAIPFVDYSRRWTVVWPYAPRRQQIHDGVLAECYELCRRAHDLHSLVDDDDDDGCGGGDTGSYYDVARNLVPVLKDIADDVAGKRCEHCCTPELDSAAVQAWAQAAWTGDGTESPTATATTATEPRVCPYCVSAWEIPLWCILANWNMDLDRLGCTADDVIDVLHDPPVRDPATDGMDGRPLVVVVATGERPVLNVDRTCVVFANVMNRRDDDDEEDDDDDEDADADCKTGDHDDDAVADSAATSAPVGEWEWGTASDHNADDDAGWWGD